MSSTVVWATGYDYGLKGARGRRSCSMRCTSLKRSLRRISPMSSLLHAVCGHRLLHHQTITRVTPRSWRRIVLGQPREKLLRQVTVVAGRACGAARTTWREQRSLEPEGPRRARQPRLEQEAPEAVGRRPPIRLGRGVAQHRRAPRPRSPSRLHVYLCSARRLGGSELCRHINPASVLLSGEYGKQRPKSSFRP
jgi:hypothetical protein